MGIVRAIRKGLRRALRAAGFEITRTNQIRWGGDVGRDVKRLADMRGRKIDTILDVGANVGQSALSFREFFPAARIVCYEPSKRMFELLVGNTKPHTNIECVNVALADKPGEMTLHVYPELEHINSLGPLTSYTTRFPSEAQLVPCVVETVDRSAEKLGLAHIGFMKVDVEGFELQVLKGSENFLKRGAIDYISLEFNEIRPQPGPVDGGALLPLVEFLEPFGYKFVCCYTDWIAQEGQHFVVCNALFERTAHN